MSIENGYIKRPGTPSGDGRGRRGGTRRAERKEAPAQNEGLLDEDYLDSDFTEEDFAEDDFAEEIDLFDEVSIHEDASIAEDLGMEEKIFGQAMASKKEKARQSSSPFYDGERPETSVYGMQRKRTGREDRAEAGRFFGAEDPYERGRSAARGGSGTARDGRRTQTGGRSPRELNTAGSTVDQKRLKREKEQKKKSRLKTIIGWTVVEALTLLLIFGYGYVLRNLSRMSHPQVDKAAVENNNITMEKKKEMEGYMNFYIFGVDGRNSNVGRGLNSDVIMIASINQDTGDIKLCSVFRDTYLNVNDKNSYNKINQAYAQGGPEQAIAALNKNLDLNITNYVTFNWSAVAHGINILGGVDNINVDDAELYYINAYITETVNATGIGSYQLKSTGPQHLDGVQAVAYARLRLMDNDFARTERQKEIIAACFEKAKKADFAVLNNILVDCFPMVAIDIEFSDLVRLAQSITKYNLADTGGFPWQRGDANIPKKGACVIPATLESNVIRLHQFLFGDENYQPSEAVLRYSQKIKEDTNLYKEGRPIESVGTDGGVIQKPKTTAADEEETGESTTKERESSTEGYTIGVDENGNYIYPTDEDGNIVIPTDEDGSNIYPTDEDGNVIRQTRPSQTSESQTRPSELATEGDAGSEIVDEDGNVLGTSPNPTRPQTVNPTGSHTVNPTGSHTVNPTGTHPGNESGSTHPVNPTGTHPGNEGGSTQRPTELVPEEPQTVNPAPAPGGDSGPVVSPTRPVPTEDFSGPGGSGGLTPGGGNAPSAVPEPAGPGVSEGPAGPGV